MKAKIVWCFGIFLLLVCCILWVQKIRLKKDLADFQIVLEQKSTPLVALEEPNASPKIDLEELERLQKSNLELIRLRNKFGLLQNEITALNRQKEDLLREKQQAEAPQQLTVIAPIFDKFLRDTIRDDNLALIHHQGALEETKAELARLAKTLNNPDAQTNVRSRTNLPEAEIQQLRLYTDLKRDFEMHHRLVQVLTAQLKYNTAGLNEGK